MIAGLLFVFTYYLDSLLENSHQSSHHCLLSSKRLYLSKLKTLRRYVFKKTYLTKLLEALSRSAVYPL